MASTQGAHDVQTERDLLQATRFAKASREYQIAETLRQAVNNHQHGDQNSKTFHHH